MTNLQQQLGAQQQALQQLQAVMDAQQASAAQRENALQAQLADLSDRWNLKTAEAESRVEPEPVARRHRAFIESRALCLHVIVLSAEPRQCHAFHKCHMQCRDYFVSFQFFEWDASHPPSNVWFSPTCASDTLEYVSSPTRDWTGDRSRWLGHPFQAVDCVCCTHRAKLPMPSVFGERSRRCRCERIS